MLKDSSGKYDSADTFVVEKMGLKLLETGADIARTDRAGNNPLSILGQRGMKDGALYTAAQSTVSAQAQASVVMNAKLGLLQAALPLIREYIALGFSPQEAAAAAGLTLPPPTANPAKQTYLALPQGTAPAAAPPQPEQGQNPRE